MYLAPEAFFCPRTVRVVVVGGGVVGEQFVRALASLLHLYYTSA